MPCNRHYRAVAGLRFGKLSDGMVPKIMEAEVWKSGGFPKVAPCSAPACHRPHRVEVRSLTRREYIMLRLDKSECLGTPVKRENGIPCIGVGRDNSLPGLGLALADRERSFHQVNVSPLQL